MVARMEPGPFGTTWEINDRATPPFASYFDEVRAAVRSAAMDT